LTNLENYNLSRSEWEKVIDEYLIGRNSERNRKMLKRRLLDGITYERLAEEFDMSVQNVCSTIYKCQDKVFKHL
jgi:DNA-directed RNA polymerase specialized sigma24 family protein